MVTVKTVRKDSVPRQCPGARVAGAGSTGREWPTVNTITCLTTKHHVHLRHTTLMRRLYDGIDLFENSFWQAIILDCPGNAS